MARATVKLHRPNSSHLLLLDRIHAGGGEPPNLVAVENAANGAYRIANDMMRAEAMLTVRAMSDRAEDSLAGRFRASGITLRNPGVPERWWDLLEIFGNTFDPELERALPFSMPSALRIVRAMQTSALYKVSKHYARVRAASASAWRAYRDRSLVSRLPQGLDSDRLFENLGHPGTRPKRSIESRVYKFFLAKCSNIGFVDIADVARLSGVAHEVVDTFCALFSLGRQEVSDYDFLPSSRNALARTPLIATDRGYFAPSLPLVQWALLPRIEALINPNSGVSITRDGRAWTFYERQRSRFLEGATAQILARASDRAPLLNEIYSTSDPAVRFEIDVSARLDTTMYVVECKATTLSDAARRGAQASVDRVVQNIVAEASVQLSRSISMLTTRHGAAWEFIPMIVTLDHSGAIGAGLRTAEYHGSTDGLITPWVLSLLDLYTVQDLLETPWQFKHYAQQRLLSVKRRRATIAHDELDLYHTYRYTNTCAMPNGGSHFIHIAGSGEIDDYYSSVRTGKRRKPKPSNGTRLLNLFEDLERCGDAGWSDIACDILNLPNEALVSFRSALERTRTGVRGTVVWRAGEPIVGWGLTYIATNEPRLADALLTVQVLKRPLNDGINEELFIVHNPIARKVKHGLFVCREGQWSRLTSPSWRFIDRSAFISVAAPWERRLNVGRVIGSRSFRLAAQQFVDKRQTVAAA